MPTTEQLIIEIKAQNKDLITKVNEVQGKLGQVEGKTADMGKSTAVSLAKMAGGWMAVKTAVKFVVNTLKESVAAAVEQNRVEAQLNATLKSTGMAAGLTSKELLKMASGLQSMTNYGDEAIIGAENILLTFTKIGRDVFPNALKSVLNMSTALGTDLKSSSIMIGKALNDPIQGISALTRAGVQFSEEQQKVIKTMAETGRVADAQAMILKELEVQFGGSAEAAVKADGGMTQLSNTIGDLKEILGNFIIKTITPFIVGLKNIIVNIIDFYNKSIILKSIYNELIRIFDFLKQSLNKSIEFINKFWYAFLPIVPLFTLISKGGSILFNVLKDLSKEQLSLTDITNQYADAQDKLKNATNDLTEAEKKNLEVKRQLLGDEIIKKLKELEKEYDKVYNQIEKNSSQEIDNYNKTQNLLDQREKKLTEIRNIESLIANTKFENLIEERTLNNDLLNSYMRQVKAGQITVDQAIEMATITKVREITEAERLKKLNNLQDIKNKKTDELRSIQEDISGINKENLELAEQSNKLSEEINEKIKTAARLYHEGQLELEFIPDSLKEQIKLQAENIRMQEQFNEILRKAKEEGLIQTVVPTVVPIFDTSEIEADIENWKKTRPKIELPIELGEIKRTKKDFGDLGKNLGKGLIDSLKGSDAKAGAQEFGNKIAGALQQMGGWMTLIGTIIQIFWGKTSAQVKNYIYNLIGEINKFTVLFIETIIRTLMDPSFLFNLVFGVIIGLAKSFAKLFQDIISGKFIKTLWQEIKQGFLQNFEDTEVKLNVKVKYSYERYLKYAQETGDFDRYIQRAKNELARLQEEKQKIWDLWLKTKDEKYLDMYKEAVDSIIEQKQIIRDLYRAEIDYNRKLLDMKQKINAEGLTDIMLIEERIKFIKDILASQKELGQYGLSAMEKLDLEDELIDLEKEYVETVKQRQLIWDDELEHRKKIGMYEGRELDFINDMIRALNNQLNYLKSINDYGKEYEDIQERIYALQQQQTEEIQNQIDKEKELKMEKLDENQKLYNQLVRMYARNKREADGLLNMYDQFRFRQEKGIYEEGGFDITEAIRLSELGVNLLESNQMRDIMSLGIRDLFSAMQISGSTTVNNFDFGAFIQNLNTQAADPDLLYQKFLSFIEIFGVETGS